MFKNYANGSIDVRVSPSGLAVALKVGSPGLESRTEHYEKSVFCWEDSDLKYAYQHHAPLCGASRLRGE
jgi:hypothetical protein